jgi:HEAT repeat protein
VLFQLFLAAGAATVMLVWAGIAGYLLIVERKRVLARRHTASAVSILETAESRGLSVPNRLAQVRALLDQVSREMIMHAAAERTLSQDAFEALIAYLGGRHDGRSLEQDAVAHRTTRDKWRRMTALRILFRANHSGVMGLLRRAADEPDADVAAVAFSQLGQSADPQAIEILIDALRGHRHPASRVAVHLEHSQQLTAGRLKPLLHEDDPVVRLWAATLFARFPEPEVEHALAPLADDSDPRVRKAAIQTLGLIGDVIAVDCAERLLKDSVSYVRAHAARALGQLGQVELADRVVALLGDKDWWVRRAAKDSLEMMGTEVWPVMMRSLNHKDRFVRNGAAEVIQNLGILDSLIVMEAASDNPAESKIAMLRRIASAGGVRFTDSLVERAGPVIGPRIRGLLASIGMERVEAA